MNALQLWLEQYGLESLYPLLSQHDIDLDIITELSEANLEALGLTLGKRKRLMRAIAALQADNAAPAPEPTASSVVQNNPASYESNPQRRQLTVLFCDLVGSTELSQKLDLEDLRDALMDYQSTVSSLFKDSRGFIARYMGDGVLVYFGYPAALEDDALSAVSAAQQILETFQHSPRFVKAGFKVRIGIATGLVLAGEIVGSGASEEHTVLGRTPNLAARLQGVAGPNQMVVDDQTWLLIRRRYTANKLDNLTLKGFDGYLTAYEVPVQQPRSQFTQPEDYKLIDRKHEFHELQMAWHDVCQGKRRTVLLNGEPGIGKSRLIREFGNLLSNKRPGSQPGRFVQWMCSPHSSNSAFFTVIQYLQEVCGFAANDADRVKRDKIIETADVLGLTEEDAERLTQVLSIAEPESGNATSTPRERREELINLLIEMFLRFAKQQPTTLVVEDIHAIDPSTLEFLQTLMSTSEESALMLLFSCRPEFDVSAFSSFDIKELPLSPLDNNDCSDLILELGKFPSSLMQEILKKADGVPLYVEEITRAFFDAARQTLASGSNTDGIPSTLQSLLLAKLDRLGPARELAQMAAVVGDEIDIVLLRALSEKSDRMLQHDLELLNAAGVLVNGVGAKKNQFRFRHTLFQEVAYQTLLRDDRKRLHLKVGESIRDEQPELAASQPERVARHFTAARSLEQAIRYWHLAATRASAMSANDECFSYIEAAKPLLADLDSVSQRDYYELELNIVHASVLRGTAGPAGDLIAGIYERSLVLCESTGQNDKLVAPLNGLYIYNLLRTHYAKATEFANRLLSLANESGDVTSRMAGHRALGAVSFNTGELDRASEHLQKSRQLYDPEIHDTSAITIGADHLQVATSFYCVTISIQGRPQTALALHVDELKRAETLAHAHNTAQLLVFLTFHSSISARSETAYYCQKLYEIADEFNFPMMMASAQFFRGSLKLYAGDFKLAYEQMKSAFELYQSTGTLNYLPYFKMRTAEACLALGEFDQAKTYLSESESVLESTGECWCLAELYRLWGEYEKLANHDSESAQRYFDKAVSDARDRGAMLWLLRALQSKIAIAISADAKLEAQAQLDDLIVAWPELKSTFQAPVVVET